MSPTLQVYKVAMVPFMYSTDFRFQVLAPSTLYCTYCIHLLYYISPTIRVSVLQYCVIIYIPIQFFLHMHVGYKQTFETHIPKYNLYFMCTYSYLPYFIFLLCMYVHNSYYFLFRQLLWAYWFCPVSGLKRRHQATSSKIVCHGFSLELHNW